MNEKKLVELIPNPFEFACEHLPEDWEIRIDLARNAGSVELINPEGEVVNEFADDDGTFSDFIRERINFARESDGLMPLEWDGSTVHDL